MLNFVICDDNINVLQTLKKFLEAIFIENKLNAKLALDTANPFELLGFSKNNQIDVVILDIDLKSDKNGVDIAAELRKNNKNLYIIFITGYMDYVFQCLKTKIFDYLLKPITYEKIKSCILRLTDDIQGRNYYIRLNNRVTVKQNDIIFIEKICTKCIIYLENSKIPIYGTLENIYKKLSQNFVRCHKSYIVNIDKIQNIDYTENILSLDSNYKCSIGLKYKSNLSEVLKDANNFGNLINS